MAVRLTGYQVGYSSGTATSHTGFKQAGDHMQVVVGLNIEHFDLEQGTVTVYRGKTDETQVHQLKKHTRLAAEDYLAAIGCRSGPLFLGYRLWPL